MDYKKLARIIIRVKIQSASKEERDLLYRWLDENEVNHQLYKDIIRGKSIYKRLKLEEGIKNTMDFERIKEGILKHSSNRKRIEKRRLLRWGAVAASMVGVIYLMFLIRSTGRDDTFTQLVVREKPVTVLQPTGAVLVLSSGKQIELNQHRVDSIKILQATILVNDSLFPAQIDSLSEPGEWNRVITPKGKDCSFILADGSRVWMNAGSVLEFPADFIKSKRMVKLTGEAYFEVKPDPARPFVVYTGKMQTKVLGTSFNVKAYEDEERVYTTLVKGKVEVSLGEGTLCKIVLTPGVQSEWEKGTENLVSRGVDVSTVMSWREGVYKFEETDLKAVLRVLSRWYDVQFVYDDKNTKKHTFNGYISKKETLSSILETFTMAGGPQFRVIDDHTIEVQENSI